MEYLYWLTNEALTIDDVSWGTRHFLCKLGGELAKINLILVQVRKSN